jgi:hypothetical protein
MFQEEKIVDYLEMFRDENYQSLSEILKKSDAGTVASFCYYLAKYEGVHHLDFVRQLLK